MCAVSDEEDVGTGEPRRPSRDFGVALGRRLSNGSKAGKSTYALYPVAEFIGTAARALGRFVGTFRSGMDMRSRRAGVCTPHSSMTD